MVYTTNNTPICRRLKDFILSIFSLIYLFFATIFGDPKAMNGNKSNIRGNFKKSNGVKGLSNYKSGSAPGGG
jgi:hypothetical protein|tara:strand:+ start:922 stop:1137 length:216 start_codon:yes stop_codon:yes gene_type:complete